MTNRSIEWQKKFWLGDPVLDKVFKVLIQVAGELYVTKNRLKFLENYMKNSGVIVGDDFEKFELTGNEAEEIEKERDLYIETILAPIVAEEDNTV
jgi:hypothetical protein